MFFLTGNNLDLQRAILVIGLAIIAGKRSYKSTLTKVERANMNRQFCEDPRNKLVKDLEKDIKDTLFNL